MEGDVIVCRACGRALSRPVTRLAHLPEREFVDEERISLRPTVAVGTWAVDPGPRMHRANGDPADTLGCLVLNPEDAVALEVHPDPYRNSGCCGHDGLDGPNRRCAGCHVEVATLCDDCWSVVELRFEPSAVRVTSAP